MATEILDSYTSSSSHTDVKREIIRIPAKTFTGANITGITLTIKLRHGNYSNSTPSVGKMWISNGYTPLSNWSYQSGCNCPYQTSSNHYTYFNSENASKLLTGDMLVSAQQFSFIVPNSGNQTYTASFVPTITTVSSWSGKDLYVGYEKVSTPYDCAILWGSGVIAVSLAITYTAFTPNLVTRGQLIQESDYNQIRNAYSALGAVSEGSLITKANIDSVRAYNANVGSATQGAVITADYFNNNVLNKISG